MGLNSLHAIGEKIRQEHQLWSSLTSALTVNFQIQKQHYGICVQKENQLDATEWFIALIICSKCFGHFYAHHQELETLCMLLTPMMCDALVAGCWRSGAGQPAMRPGW